MFFVFVILLYFLFLVLLDAPARGGALRVAVEP